MVARNRDLKRRLTASLFQNDAVAASGRAKSSGSRISRAFVHVVASSISGDVLCRQGAFRLSARGIRVARFQWRDFDGL
jgi:hypothetical protein